MRGVMLYGPRDVRVEERSDPTIIEPTDAIIRLPATCVCGSDLWPYRGIEAVGTQESMLQAIRSTRPGGSVGSVGVSHGVDLPGEELFFAEVHLLGGPAPVRRFLPKLIDLIWRRQINPGKVFDLELPLAQAAEGYRSMDERRAIKALLIPEGA